MMASLCLHLGRSARAYLLVVVVVTVTVTVVSAIVAVEKMVVLAVVDVIVVSATVSVNVVLATVVVEVDRGNRSESQCRGVESTMSALLRYKSCSIVTGETR